MGAGGGMWASAREELRRPGLSGGGGGKPLFTAAGLNGTTGVAAAGGTATGTAFLLAVTGTGLDLTGLAEAFGTGLVDNLAMGLPTTLTEAFCAGVAAVLATLFVAAFAALANTLTLTGGALATGFGADFFTADLEFTAGLPTVLGSDLGLAVVFTGTLATDLLAALAGLAAFLAAATGFLAAWFALADFAGFAFTACLLWDAASG